MAVFVTKTMLTKINSKIKIPSTGRLETLDTEPWSTILAQSERGMQLSKEMICRVCGQSACHPLLDMINDQYDIMTAIRSVAHITITVDDSLPKFICTQCLEALKIAIDFKRNCEISDRNFRKIQNPMGDPAFHSYPYSKHDFHLILGKMQAKKRKREELKEIGRQKIMKDMKKKCGPKEKQFKCVPCDIVFPDKDKLSEHRRERQCMRRACDICGQLVLSISQHRRLIHRLQAQHKCQHCYKEFPTIARLKAHMLVHTNTFNFFCDMCPYKCKHKYYLVMHMRTHTGEKPYKCPHCPSTFVNPSNLNKHKLTHQEKQYKCALCDKTFRTSSALRDHHEAAHMNIKHTCNYCGRDFCYKSDLRKHEIRSHNRVKRDYIGGEPTYKQVERLQSTSDCKVEEKWRAEFVIDNSNVVASGVAGPAGEAGGAGGAGGAAEVALPQKHTHYLYAHDAGAYATHTHTIPQQSVAILTDMSEVEVTKHEFEVPTEIIYF